MPHTHYNLITLGTVFQSPPRTAIRITGLSKKYRLFDNPRQRLKEVLDPWHRTFHQEFWALRDVDLEIPREARSASSDATAQASLPFSRS